MKKRMGCKADGEDEYRSNLSVVRISSNHPTQQTAASSPRLYLQPSFCAHCFIISKSR